MIKHIIWDWNGTLLDDNWLSVRAMNILLDRHGLPPLDLQRYLEIFSFPVSEYYQRLGFDFQRLPFSVTGTEFIEEYTARMFQPRLHAGARELLQALQGNGITHSLLSAAKQEILDTLVAFHNLQPCFQKWVGLSDHYAHSKLEAGRARVRELSLGSRAVLFVGDTLHDSEVARELGADCILLALGHNSFSRLRATGRPVFKSYPELQQWFAGRKLI